MTDRIVTSADGRLTGVLRAGDRGRPLLLCVHGGGCDGGYFDLPGFSLAEAATARGLAVLRVDRPGYGASPPPMTSSPIDEAARLLPALVEAAREVLPAAGPLVVVGHSIGAAVALRFAADAGAAADGRIAGLAVSGLGDRPSDEADAWLDRVRRGEAGHEPSGDFFFGPEGSYSWRGPAALRRAGRAWRADEVLEVMTEWPGRFATVAGRVRVPVLFRLAEHERIWRNDPASLARMSAAFDGEPDMAILPDGGHLYEIHRRGADFVAALLDFAERIAAVRLAPTTSNV